MRKQKGGPSRRHHDGRHTGRAAVLDALDQTLIPGSQNAELEALLQQARPAFAAHLEVAAVDTVV